MSDRLFIAFLFIAVVVLSLGWLSCMGDDVRRLNDNTPEIIGDD